MKKLILFLLISINILGSTSLKLLAASDKLELKTSEATLNIDWRGILKIVHDKGQVLQVNTPVNDLWKIILKNKLTNKEYSFTSGNEMLIEKRGDIIMLTFNSLTIEGRALPVNVEFTISVRDDSFCFSGSLGIDSDEWMLKKLAYPNISGIEFKNTKAGIYWPVGLGQYFKDPSDFGSRSLRYPSGSGAAMGWFSINTTNEGLYIGSHDSLQETKVFSLEYEPSAKIFKTQINAEICDNEYSIPEIMVKPYTGEWYLASKFYRSWYDKNFKIVNSPEWVKNDAGWFLAILKQQNMEVMWPYKDIDKLCDIAERFNLSTIGLFGWAVGGHDRYYPNFPPDNLLGGREEIEKAIERAHKRGIKIIIYANGVLIDTSTDFYLYNGYETMLMQENKQPLIHYFIKQKTATPVIFARACIGSEVWRRTMCDLGYRAASLGADGILYDCVGIIGISLCYSTHHDHKPGLSDARNRLQMINEAKETAREVNPEFIVMTEGTNDAIIRGIDYHHGCGIGTAPSTNGFPGLFRYTFPELIKTQRNPNPMITKTDANFAAIYGLRHEIESRYPGDVEYLLHGTLPTAEDYSNVVSPPDINKMNLLPKEEATQYVHDLIAFENEHSDFFRRGKFIDEDGIKVQGNDIIAKGFINGNRIGLVVWNQHLSEKRNFTVTMPGYKPVKAFEPVREDVQSSSSLNPNSIRLIVFEKN